MSRLRYATPEDVLRRVTGGLYSREDLDADQVLQSNDDREKITARLEAIEAKWDREATPMRAVAVGSGDVPKYYKGRGGNFPLNVYLDHQNVHPLDSDMGDQLEVRTGRDTWTSIIDREGTAFVADYEMGKLTIYRQPAGLTLPIATQYRDRFVRTSYHISAGGDFSRAGETTVTEAIDSEETGSVSVRHADRLPEDGGLMLVDGTEYVYVSNANHVDDTVTIDERGRRGTKATSHTNGTTVHFCPMDVRDAVAALVAVELATTDDYTEFMFDGDLDRSDKIEQWQAEWDRTASQYSDHVGYH